MSSAVTVKRSPIVLIRTFTAIEVAASLAYYFVAPLSDYGGLYPFGNLLSYQVARLLFLSGIQLAITIYAFLRWYYETYTFRPGTITHEWGVFFKKKKNVPLPETVSVTSASGPLGKLLHYGSIRIENAAAHNSLTIADISRPQKHLELLSEYIGATDPEFDEGRPDMSKLLKEDEHDQLEFKSSLRFDHRNRQVNRELERTAMKVVAAFLNSKGGHLVIGVDDARQPLGLELDYGTLQRPDSDGFENHFTQVFNKMIGPEFRQLVRLWFHAQDGKDVCVIQVAPSARPVYLKVDDSEHFYVRTGNITTALKLSEVESYARSRWPRRTLS